MKAQFLNPLSCIRKKTLISVPVLLGAALFLSSCQVMTPQQGKNVEEIPTFSISSGQSDPRKCNVTSEMTDCDVFWTVESGVLTHRQSCSEKNSKYTPLMLNAMAKSLKETCPLKIRYVRMTSKDDVQSEQRLARMMMQSKTWGSYSKAPQAQRKKLADAFVAKVVDHKQLFSDVTQALSSVGYQFKLAKVDIADLSPLTQSRHFNSLRTVGASQSFLVPQNLRLVWIDSKYRPRPVRKRPTAVTPQNIETNKATPQGEIPTELPDKIL